MGKEWVRAIHSWRSLSSYPCFPWSFISHAICLLLWTTDNLMLLGDQHQHVLRSTYPFWKCKDKEGLWVRKEVNKIVKSELCTVIQSLHTLFCPPHLFSFFLFLISASSLPYPFPLPCNKTKFSCLT